MLRPVYELSFWSNAYQIRCHLLRGFEGAFSQKFFKPPNKQCEPRKVIRSESTKSLAIIKKFADKLTVERVLECSLVVQCYTLCTACNFKLMPLRKLLWHCNRRQSTRTGLKVFDQEKWSKYKN